MIPGLARKRKATGDTPCPQSAGSHCFSGRTVSWDHSARDERQQGIPPTPKQQPFTAFLDAPFLATTPHGCDRLIAESMGEVSLTLFPGLTFTAFLDAPFLATTPHGCDPLDAPDGLGLQSRTAAFTYFSPGRPQIDVLHLSCLGIPEKGSTSVARAFGRLPFGDARPPLRVPTA